MTDTTIKLGIEYAEDAGSIGSRFGGPSSGDWRVQFEAVIDDLNARGGLLGRKVTPVWLPYSIDGEYATQEQAACAEAVDDEKVFAVLAFPHSETGLTCYQRGGVVQITSGGFASFDSRDYRTYKHLASAGGASFDRLIPVWIDTLAGNGFFGAGAKIGLVTHDAPKWVRASRLVDQRLAAHGLKLARVARTTEFKTVRDGDSFSAGMGNAVVRFQQDGITHVLFLQSTSFGVGTFMDAAEMQEYRPMYGLTTNDGPWATSTPAQRSQAQLRGVRGVGFAPHKDVVQSQGPSTPGLARCLAIFAARNISLSGQNMESSATLRCDHVWLLEEAIKAGGPTINRDSFLRGLEAVGKGMSFSATFASNYTGGNRDGFGEVRAFAYDTACKCMKYTSGPVPVP